MIIVPGYTLQIVLAAPVATTQMSIAAHYVDVEIATFAAVEAEPQFENSNGTTPVDVVDAPGAGLARQLKALTAYNADTAIVVATLRFNDGVTSHIAMKASIPIGGTLLYRDGEFKVLDASGAIIVTVARPLPALSSTDYAATTSAQLAGVLSDETGDGGGFVRANNATLVAPTLGAASATSLAVPALTAPAAMTVVPVGNFSINTDDIFVEKSTGNVGIGTTSPDGTLHVHTGSSGSVTADANADNLVVEHSSEGGISILTPAASHGNLYFGNPTENSTLTLRREATTGDFVIGGQSRGEQLRLTYGGKLGIGTTAPTSKLHVTGLPVYANNAAAVAGGLTAGAFYRTGGDPDPVCVVH